MSIAIHEKHKKFSDGVALMRDKAFAQPKKSLSAEIQNRLDWIGVDWVEEDESASEEEEIGLGAFSKNVGAGKPCKFSDPKTVKVLDYACGTGFMTRTLAPYATHFIGIDASENKISQYNRRARNQGIPRSEIHGIAADLLDPLVPAPAPGSGAELFAFDLVVVGLGFHHFADPAAATRRLGERLRAGGVLLVVDLVPHAGHRHRSRGSAHARSRGAGAGDGDDGIGGLSRGAEEAREGCVEGKRGRLGAQHVVRHVGFSRVEIERMFRGAGLEDFGYVELGKGVVFEAGDVEGEGTRVFMARATKR